MELNIEQINIQNEISNFSSYQIFEMIPDGIIIHSPSKPENMDMNTNTNMGMNMNEIDVHMNVDIDINLNIEENKGENRKCLLFDLDGTLCESGKKIGDEIKHKIVEYKNKGYDLGIVGGGRYEKIVDQLDGYSEYMTYIFAECGSVFYYKNKCVHQNDLLHHSLYSTIQKLIRVCLKFISETNYDISGQFIDVRNGLVYISLIGLQANHEMREKFKKMDKRMEFRKRLLQIVNDTKNKLLKERSHQLEVKYGGEVGISIYPAEWDKIQVLKYIQHEYHEIHYFGDRYHEDGNDYRIIHDSRVIGHCVNSHIDTIEQLNQLS